MTKKLSWGLLSILLLCIFFACQKKDTLLEDKEMPINLLNDDGASITSSYNAEALAEEAAFPVDSMKHITEGVNKTYYLPWFFPHLTGDKDKTKYLPEHVTEGEHKTKFNPAWAHTPSGPDKTKAIRYHEAEGPNKTYYIPGNPYYTHITSGPNTSFFLPNVASEGGGTTTVLTDVNNETSSQKTAKHQR